MSICVYPEQLKEWASWLQLILYHTDPGVSERPQANFQITPAFQVVK